MNTQFFDENNKTKGTLSVEHNTSDFITVKKKYKDSEDVVEMLIFKKEDIEELHNIQRELYEKPSDNKSVIERLLKFLKKFSNQ